MNKWIGMGRLTKDPEVRYTQDNTAIARYTVAVDRRFAKEGQQNADFISIVAFGKAGEFAEKYLHKGMKMLVTGRIQTGSYKKEDGSTVYTTEVVAEDQEFCESKGNNTSAPAPAQNEFTDVAEDGDLPFAPPTR